MVSYFRVFGRIRFAREHLGLQPAFREESQVVGQPPPWQVARVQLPIPFGVPEQQEVVRVLEEVVPVVDSMNHHAAGTHLLAKLSE